MKNLRRRCSLLAATAIALALIINLAVSVNQLDAQSDQPSESPTEPQTNSADGIPQAALLTERGRQLAEELRLLRRSRESMGARHPTLEVINKKIAAIEEQLKAWEPAANPFREGNQSTSPQMNDYDLRQMVIKLTNRVESLEKRVLELEKARPQ